MGKFTSTQAGWDWPRTQLGNTSLWFWLMEQGDQGHGDTREPQSSWSLLERPGLGSDSPPLLKQRPGGTTGSRWALASPGLLSGARDTAELRREATTHEEALAPASCLDVVPKEDPACLTSLRSGPAPLHRAVVPFHI